MIGIVTGTASFAYILSFAVVSSAIAFILAPLLINLLNKFKIVKGVKTELAMLENSEEKGNTPVMGGLLVIITVALLTIIWNWSREFTWVPIGVMILSAMLGAIDDLMHVFGKERRSRKLTHILTLIQVHKDWKMRMWYTVTLPWSLFKRTSAWLGSKPGKGVHVHEKLMLQFAAGAITAWWIYYKLGIDWHYLYFPWGYDLYVGWLIIPIVILVVMFTANAVNIADGMDGLAGGMMIPTFSALAILSWINGFDELGVLNACVVGSLAAYTFYNIKPARFFMGDTGSLALGSLLAVNAIAIGELLPLIFIGFMFYLEAFSVLLQVSGRIILGRKILKMAPLHHHFELSGWSEEKTIMRFWIIHVIFVIFGLWLALQ